jgi:hypothetical protein
MTPTPTIAKADISSGRAAIYGREKNRKESFHAPQARAQRSGARRTIAEDSASNPALLEEPKVRSIGHHPHTRER